MELKQYSLLRHIFLPDEIHRMICGSCPRESNRKKMGYFHFSPQLYFVWVSASFKIKKNLYMYIYLSLGRTRWDIPILFK